MSTTRDKTMRDWHASEHSDLASDKAYSRLLERERVNCSCGFRGVLGDLVTNPESDDTKDIRCPLCDGKYTWVYA